MANSYEDELDKLAYVELIKKTTENMTYLTDDLIKISISQFIIEDNLDKLAGYYKLSYDLFNAQWLTYEKTF
nr:hypothetical protein [Mycoplasmopsis bovis]